MQDLAAQLEALVRISDTPSTKAWQGKLRVVALIAPGPIRVAKQSLLALRLEGRRPGRHASSSSGVRINALREYSKARDDLFKWIPLPYPKARPELERLEREFATRHIDVVAAIFLDLVRPDAKVSWASWRIERRIAALRTIEAIRLHAAANDGRLPATLADIHVVPVPDNPTTGKPFVYSVQGDHFTLSGPAFEGDTDRSQALTYEATLTR